MTSILMDTMQWHDGEQRMQRLLHVPPHDNPSVPYLSTRAADFLQRAPLVALGTLDKEGRPWSTIWGGQAGFAGPIAESIIGLRAQVDTKYDPVFSELFAGRPSGLIADNPMVSGLAIDLENRRRVKLFGHMVAGSRSDGDVGQAQLVVKIEEIWGIPIGHGPLITRRRDICVLLTRENRYGHKYPWRPPGFVRVESNGPSGAALVYPEYSGNRFYQTLGNLQTNPRAGYVIPGFETGDVLYITGHTQILVGKDAAENGLAFRGQPGEASPYNPSVRFLLAEKTIPTIDTAGDMKATLIKKETITPTIKRFRFQIASHSPVTWVPGQYATFSFDEELNIGYSHMRDDDPTSLNDDYIRTFTVSSYPGRDLLSNEFEITVRLHGKVSEYLFRAYEGAGIEVPLKGFGGSFRLPQATESDEIIPFIAGGIGITPLLGQLPDLDLSRLRLFWSISINDLGIVQDLFQKWPDLAASTTLFLTGSPSSIDDRQKSIYDIIQASKAHIELRRMQADDLEHSLADTWYLWAGPELQRSVCPG
ncbi:hypothetical protein N7488_003430 [Penicillium malachiteum]|nr:hypothetical protein N7488_003430 [Penicillium malachiteum]